MDILIKPIVKSISAVKTATKRIFTSLMVSDNKMIETAYAAAKAYPTATQLKIDSRDRWQNWSQSSIVMDQKDRFRKLVNIIKTIVVLQVFWFNILQMLL